jgi:hypothetical protein
MMNPRASIVTGLVLVGTLTGLALAAQSSAVPYPGGYLAWRQVKSMVIGAGHPLYASFGGIHHLYANQVATACFACHTTQAQHSYIFSTYRD